MSTLRHFGYTEDGDPVILDTATGWKFVPVVDGGAPYGHRDGVPFEIHSYAPPEETVYSQGLYDNANRLRDYTKLRRGDVLPETLDYYGYQWEYKKGRRQEWIIVFPRISRDTAMEMFRHTRALKRAAKISRSRDQHASNSIKVKLHDKRRSASSHTDASSESSETSDSSEGRSTTRSLRPRASSIRSRSSGTEHPRQRRSITRLRRQRDRTPSVGRLHEDFGHVRDKLAASEALCQRQENELQRNAVYMQGFSRQIRQMNERLLSTPHGSDPRTYEAKGASNESLQRAEDKVPEFVIDAKFAKLTLPEKTAYVNELFAALEGLLAELREQPRNSPRWKSLSRLIETTIEDASNKTLLWDSPTSYDTPENRHGLNEGPRPTLNKTASTSKRVSTDPENLLQSAVNTWSDSRLKAFLDARGVPVPQSGKRDELIASVRLNQHKASTGWSKIPSYGKNESFVRRRFSALQRKSTARANDRSEAFERLSTQLRDSQLSGSLNAKSTLEQFTQDKGKGKETSPPAEDNAFVLPDMAEDSREGGKGKGKQPLSKTISDPLQVPTRP